jgi:V8-like Glu-specific endopeptidase
MFFSWPAQAYIQSCGSTGCNVCAGTLIDPKTVVTAAHCINESTQFDINVYLGIHDTTQTDSANFPPYLPSQIIVVIINYISFRENEERFYGSFSPKILEIIAA